MKPLVIAAIGALAALAAASPASAAAPKLDNLVVKPVGKGPDVEVSVTIARTRFDSQICDARLDFGDGSGRTLDFGMAATRSAKHSYRKNGTYTVSVKGSGSQACEGSRSAPVTIAGIAEAKKPEPKKAEKPAAKKKPEPKKKAQSTKKGEPKKKGEGKKKADEKGKKKDEKK